MSMRTAASTLSPNAGLRRTAVALVMCMALPVTAATARDTIDEERIEPGLDVPTVDPGLAYQVPEGTTPSVYTIGGGSFSPSASALTYQTIGGAIIATALPAPGLSLQADVGLPIGAAITAIRFYVVDNHPTNFSLSLRSYNPETDSYVAVLSSSSIGSSTTPQTVSLVPAAPIVVDGSLALSLRVQPGATDVAHTLRGARIEYLPPTLFMNGFEALATRRTASQ